VNNLNLLNLKNKSDVDLKVLPLLTIFNEIKNFIKTEIKLTHKTPVGALIRFFTRIHDNYHAKNSLYNISLFLK
jgi:hypothetical protein